MSLTKTNTLQEDYELITIHDDDVDREAKNFDAKWQRYVEGKGPPPLKDKASPTRFQFRHHSPEARERIRDLMMRGRGFEAMRLSCRAALVGVIGPVAGEEVVVRRDFEDGIEVANREAMEKIPDSVVHEFGAAAWGKVRLSGK